MVTFCPIARVRAVIVLLATNGLHISNCCVG